MPKTKAPERKSWRAYLEPEVIEQYDCVQGGKDMQRLFEDTCKEIVAINPKAVKSVQLSCVTLQLLLANVGMKIEEHVESIRSEIGRFNGEVRDTDKFKNAVISISIPKEDDADRNYYYRFFNESSIRGYKIEVTGVKNFENDARLHANMLQALRKAMSNESMHYTSMNIHLANITVSLNWIPPSSLENDKRYLSVTYDKQNAPVYHVNVVEVMEVYEDSKMCTVEYVPPETKMINDRSRSHPALQVSIQNKLKSFVYTTGFLLLTGRSIRDWASQVKLHLFVLGSLLSLVPYVQLPELEQMYDGIKVREPRLGMIQEPVKRARRHATREQEEDVQAPVCKRAMFEPVPATPARDPVYFAPVPETPIR